jgi:hypothetical protein
MIRTVQRVVDDFLKRNRWNAVCDFRSAMLVTASRERECFRRVKRDGEALIRFFPNDDGTMEIRFVEPEQLRTPPGGSWMNGWSFGIHHQMEPREDVETPIEYHFAWQDISSAQEHDVAGQLNVNQTGLGELVPAEEVVHLKGPETDASIARGTPEFVYEVGAALDRASKLQRNVSMGAAIRAATAEIWKHTFGTQSQLQGLAGTFGTPHTDPATGASIPRERLYPGTIRRVPAGQEPVFPPGNSGVAEHLEAVQGDLRMAGSALSAPEYWTGDSSNGNYASLREASAPAVKNGETEQEYFKAAYQRVVWKAVEWACESGKLPAQFLELVELQVEAPAVLHNDKLATTQANQIAIQNGWKSRQTVAMEDGLDPDIEFANNQEWQDRFGPEMGELPLPGEDGQLLPPKEPPLPPARK